MAGKNTAAFGIYSNEATADTAVDQLLAAGFSNDDVSVLMSDVKGTKEFAAEKNTKAPECTATGVGVGGVVGGTLGLWLASARSPFRVSVHSLQLARLWARLLGWEWEAL